MTLQSAIEQVLPELRSEAEARMVDTFTAYAPNGRTVVSGLEVPGYSSEGSTVGRVQGGSSATRDPSTEYMTVGGTRRPIIRGGLHIPLSSPIPTSGDLGHGWEYACTAVGSLSDPSLVGRRYLVVNVPAKSNATARRLDVVEL